jgi:ParB family chromosome partitioning protein
MTEYELVAGERRLRAAKIAGLPTVPTLIRDVEDDDKTKLEIAIIENLQREDLNAVDRAKAFSKLVEDFGFKHTEIAEKVGKSREYVSNTIRLLALPEEIQTALAEGKISEGHTRPLLMLVDKPEQQNTLYREIMFKKLTVRDSEAIARRIATDRVRKKEYLYSPDVLAMERELTEALGTRVAIETKENGGKLSIDFSNEDDLRAIFNTIAKHREEVMASPEIASRPSFSSSELASHSPSAEDGLGARVQQVTAEETAPIDDRSAQEKELDENTFDPGSFSL